MTTIAFANNVIGSKGVGSDEEEEYYNKAKFNKKYQETTKWMQKVLVAMTKHIGNHPRQWYKFLADTGASREDLHVLDHTRIPEFEHHMNGGSSFRPHSQF